MSQLIEFISVESGDSMLGISLNRIKTFKKGTRFIFDCPDCPCTPGHEVVVEETTNTTKIFGTDGSVYYVAKSKTSGQMMGVPSTLKFIEK